MAQDEAARVAKKLADLDAKTRLISSERNQLSGEHDAALALIDDARADLRKQRKLAHKYGHSSVHDIVSMPESVDSDVLVEIPVIDYSETSGPDEVNCGLGPGCLSMAEADDNMPALAIA